MNSDLIFLSFFELVPTIGTQLTKFLQQLSLNIRKKNGTKFVRDTVKFEVRVITEDCVMNGK